MGKTRYSGAAANVIPAASAGSRQRFHVSMPTSWPAREQFGAEREHRERVAGVAERAEQDPHSRFRAYPTISSPTHGCHSSRPSRRHPRAS